LDVRPESAEQGKQAPPPEGEGQREAGSAARRSRFDGLLVPLLAVITALILGSVFIVASNPAALEAWAGLLRDPLKALSTSWQTVRDAYLALLVGAFGSPAGIAEALGVWRSTGETRQLMDALRPVSESLVITTPYILAGLAVALGFRGGVFNIGAEGQLFIGGLAAAFVGYSVRGLPAVLHVTLALLAGVAGGALWGAIPGYLKAKTGAHEVINTIMMNYIAFRLTDYLLSGPMARPDGLPITPEVLPTAYLPLLLARPARLHLGFILALLLAGAVWWFLWKTTWGFEVRMAGANPRAANYAGVHTGRTIVMTMALSGALAGMAGAIQILGVDHRMVRAFSTGYGFDAIALALLGNSTPLGVVLSSLLFGFLRGGAARMQSVASVPVELIRIIQGMVIVFIAAPAIIRGLYRLKSARKEDVVLSRSWSA
jgi:simple sugar transport system permease protein